MNKEYEEGRKIKELKPGHIYITHWGIKFLLYTSNDNVIKALRLNGHMAGFSEKFDIKRAYIGNYRIIK